MGDRTEISNVDRYDGLAPLLRGVYLPLTWDENGFSAIREYLGNKSNKSNK